MKPWQKILLVVVVIGIISLIAFVAVVYNLITAEPTIHKHSYLIMEVSGPVLEYPPVDFVAQLAVKPVKSLTQMLENIQKARVDKRIDGIILKIFVSDANWGKLQELRAALSRFKATGKKVFVYSEYLANSHYYLATVADSIFMPPCGMLLFSGLASEQVFVKNTLKKLGIKENIIKIEKYKTATEFFQNDRMSPENRRMTEWLLDDQFNDFITTIANDRNLKPKAVKSLLNRLLFNAKDAQQAGLIDRVLYWDELEEKLKARGERRFRSVNSSTYAQIKPESVGLRGKVKIAVIHAQGAINWGENGFDPLFGLRMGSATMVRLIKSAQKAKGIKAIIFRIDSPGGNGIASDAISHQIEIAAKKKPVIVSMCDVAASGGYMIAYRAPVLVANPGTYTGSIGLFSMKFNLKGFYDKLGITKDFVTRGKHATFYSDYRDFTPAEKQILIRNSWDFYNTWIENIAKFRHLRVGQVDSLARGRVWTGRQAKQNGLIDVLGDLETAIEIAKKKAGISKEVPVKLVHYPRRKGFLESLLSKNFLTISSRHPEVLLYRLLGRLETTMQQCQWLPWMWISK
ncbi:signal peptide peptidase SppA [candidate division KSB1 bacterium]|nr:MAG: signal peptide peptidase SppA [candidate division KSB1 bacterium]